LGDKLENMQPLDSISVYLYPLLQIIIGLFLLTLGASAAKWIVRLFGAVLVILGIIWLL
jgi:uncharacterized membrane protein HdeD (DUF308 family)